jgi:hypothetical protein
MNRGALAIYLLAVSSNTEVLLSYEMIWMERSLSEARTMNKDEHERKISLHKSKSSARTQILDQLLATNVTSRKVKFA